MDPKTRRWHPLVIAALAIGFWSQVFVWRSFLHGGAHQEELELAVAPTPPRRVVSAPPPSAIPARLERLRKREYVCTRGLREEPPPAPPEDEIREAARASAPDITAHVADLPRLGRLEVCVQVGASGRVSRVTIDSQGTTLSRAGHRAIERALKKQPFPKFDQAYVSEFPLIVQRGD